jgi:hypothetical protein
MPVVVFIFSTTLKRHRRAAARGWRSIYKETNMIEEIQEMISEHVDKHYYLIPVGKKVAYTELFGKLLLQSTTSLDQHYVLKGTLDHLVACGEVDFEFAGVNDEKETLYRKIEP